MTEAERWVQDGGEHTLRLDYDLSASDVVFDIGGHTGKFTSDLLNGQTRRSAKAVIFEPVPVYFWRCFERFRFNPMIRVRNYGLSSKSYAAPMSVKGEESSEVFCTTGNPHAMVNFVDIAEVMGEFPEVALASINIEGGEYPLLNRILDTGLVTSFRNLQIQFHDIVPSADHRRDTIRERLARTHVQSYCYPFVWESWRRK